MQNVDPPKRPWQPAEIAGAFALVLLTLAVFLRVTGYDFVNLDDPGYVLDNAKVRAGLTAQSVFRDFTQSHAGFWIPLTWLSLQLDYVLFGLWAGGYHSTNLLLHLANTLLLFTLLRRMTGQSRPSFVVAALFALHPLHVESVAWVTERKDVLSTFFWLLTLWAYVRYAEFPGIRRYLVVAAILALGLMAKPMLVTLPFVLLLLDFWPLGRVFANRRQGPAPDSFPSDANAVTLGGGENGAGFDRRSPNLSRLVGEKLPLFGLALACGVITLLVQARGGVLLSLETIPLECRVLHAFTAWMHYLAKTLWPVNLAVFYPHPRTAVAVWSGLMNGVVLLSVSVLVIWAGRRRPYLPVGWFWFVGTLLPAIGLIQSGPQAWADRFTYVPLIGLFIMAAWLLEEPPHGIGRAVGVSLEAVLVSACLALTAVQVSYWRNSETLWQHALQVTRDNYLAHWNLAAFLTSAGRTEEALGHYLECLHLQNDVPGHIRVADLLLNQGRPGEAAQHCRRVLQEQPAHPVARNQLGRCYFLQGKTELAIKQFQDAVALAPGYAEAHDNLGMALGAQGRWTEAAAHLQQAARLAPGVSRYTDHLLEARQHSERHPRQ